jgi:hypothetical protein
LWGLKGNARVIVLIHRVVGFTNKSIMEDCLVKNATRMFVVFAFSLASFLAYADIVKVPVDPSVTAALVFLVQ